MRRIEFVPGNRSDTCGIAENETSLQISWALIDICAGTLSPDESEALRASDSDSVLFFDRRFGRLVGMRIRIPETNVSTPKAVFGQMPSTKGLPIRTRGSATGLRTPTGRYYDPDLDLLIVPYEPHIDEGSVWKLEAGPDLALVVASETPVAWIVERASRNLESPKSGAPKTPRLGTVQARRAIAAYLSLVDDAFVIRLETQDPAARGALMSLRDQCLGVHDGVGEILAEWADDILDTFGGFVGRAR